MKKLLLLLFCFMVFGNGQAQEPEVPENIVNHKVLMGETVILIAKKYKITPQDIYEYNSDAADGIGPNMFLKIPLHRQVDLSAPKPEKEAIVSVAASPENQVKEVVKKEKPKTQAQESYTKPLASTENSTATTEVVTTGKPQPIMHNVQSGETLTGLARKYGTTITEIKNQNADKLRHGLQTGQTLSIVPTAGYGTNDGFTLHDVQPGETLFGLSKKYGVSVDQITAANQRLLKHGLQSGQTLSIPAGGVSVQEPSIAEATNIQTETVVETQPTVVATASVEDTATSTVEHKVESGETLTGLARKYNTTIDEITNANKKALKHGLQAGQVIVIKPNTTNY